MGYTHYFHSKGKNLDQSKFRVLSDQARRIINIANKQGIKIQFEYCDNKPPELTNYAIRFNGIEEDGHETFMITREEFGEFCKTARKPYDTIVTAILIAAKLIFKNDIDISSDGDNEDWNEGRKLFEDAISIKPTVTIVGDYRTLTLNDK